jgi:hypothetical protein
MSKDAVRATVVKFCRERWGARVDARLASADDSATHRALRLD